MKTFVAWFKINYKTNLGALVPCRSESVATQATPCVSLHEAFIWLA
jgi:hypothetical protein